MLCESCFQSIWVENTSKDSLDWLLLSIFISIKKSVNGHHENGFDRLPNMMRIMEILVNEVEKPVFYSKHANL